MTIARAKDTRRKNALVKVEVSIRIRAKEAKVTPAKAKDGMKKARAKDGARKARAKEEYTHWMSGGGRGRQTGARS